MNEESEIPKIESDTSSFLTTILENTKCDLWDAKYFHEHILGEVFKCDDDSKSHGMASRLLSALIDNKDRTVNCLELVVKRLEMIRDDVHKLESRILELQIENELYKSILDDAKIRNKEKNRSE